MARLAPAPPGSYSVATRFCVWAMGRIFGRAPRPYAIYAHAPRAVPALTLMNAAFETGRWALEPGLRKLVHLRVAQIVGCVF
jgi:alkylhydroperoxidase family enzyme